MIKLLWVLAIPQSDRDRLLCYLDVFIRLQSTHDLGWTNQRSANGGGRGRGVTRLNTCTRAYLVEKICHLFRSDPYKVVSFHSQASTYSGKFAGFVGEAVLSVLQVSTSSLGTVCRALWRKEKNEWETDSTRKRNKTWNGREYLVNKEKQVIKNERSVKSVTQESNRQRTQWNRTV